MFDIFERMKIYSKSSKILAILFWYLVLIYLLQVPFRKEGERLRRTSGKLENFVLRRLTLKEVLELPQMQAGI
jgi:hypothetical protein